MIEIEAAIAITGVITISVTSLWAVWDDRRQALRAHRLRKLELLVARCH